MAGALPWAATASKAGRYPFAARLIRHTAGSCCRRILQGLRSGSAALVLTGHGGPAQAELEADSSPSSDIKPRTATGTASACSAAWRPFGRHFGIRNVRARSAPPCYERLRMRFWTQATTASTMSKWSLAACRMSGHLRQDEKSRAVAARSLDVRTTGSCLQQLTWSLCRVSILGFGGTQMNRRNDEGRTTAERIAAPKGHATSVSLVRRCTWTSRSSVTSCS